LGGGRGEIVGSHLGKLSRGKLTYLCDFERERMPGGCVGWMLICGVCVWVSRCGWMFMYVCVFVGEWVWFGVCAL